MLTVSKIWRLRISRFIQTKLKVDTSVLHVLAPQLQTVWGVVRCVQYGYRYLNVC